jgi:hypothetical protein
MRLPQFWLSRHATRQSGRGRRFAKANTREVRVSIAVSNTPPPGARRLLSDWSARSTARVTETPRGHTGIRMPANSRPYGIMPRQYAS